MPLTDDGGKGAAGAQGTAGPSAPGGRGAERFRAPGDPDEPGAAAGRERRPYPPGRTAAGPEGRAAGR
ncbi:hypothetical protein LUX33_51895 [Actinomadura madurae]|uniref:hypothetical protein n=1 Tax=Actinomadura madurae TaxID=1993 RepID=UPI0020D24681|nr:hypothetical protein [Actinomadura madurae]MCP9956002.1 hypothetical protein [Actinomadura madurae]